MSPYEQLVASVHQAETDRRCLAPDGQAYVVALIQETELRARLSTMPEHLVQQANWRHRVEQNKRRRRVSGVRLIEELERA